MFTLFEDSEKIDESGMENDSIWTHTPLQDFGFKCIMNEHNLYHDPKYSCFCHQKKKNS